MPQHELEQYMQAQTEEITQAYETSGGLMPFDAFAILWIDTHAVTFRQNWEARAA